MAKNEWKELIKEKGSNGVTWLHAIAAEGKIEWMEEMIKYGADVNAADNNGHTPLHYAVKNEQNEAVKVLLKNGADANAKDNEGYTPLHFCAIYTLDNVGIARLLLDNGAELQAKSNRGSVPLVEAFLSSNFCLVPFFLYLIRKSEKEASDNMLHDKK